MPLNATAALDLTLLAGAHPETPEICVLIVDVAVAVGLAVADNSLIFFVFGYGYGYDYPRLTTTDNRN